LAYTDPLGLWPFGLPGKGSALKNGPSWVDYYLPGLSDPQKTNLVEKAVDGLRWSDIFKGKKVFGSDFKPPKPEDVQNLTPDQKGFIEDFVNRINPDKEVKDRIKDLLNTPETGDVAASKTGEPNQSKPDGTNPCRS